MRINTHLNGQSPLRGQGGKSTPELPPSVPGDNFHSSRDTTLQMAGAGAMLCVMTVSGFVYAPQIFQQAQVKVQDKAEATPTPVEAVKQATARPARPAESETKVAQVRVAPVENAPTTLYQPVEEAAKPAAESDAATMTRELQALRAELKQMKQTQQEVRDTQKKEVEREQARRDAKVAAEVGGAILEMGVKTLICAIADCC